MDLSAAVWRTSSYTSPNSNNCVEVADLPVVAPFRTSSYSNASSNNCVEVADALRMSAVRDTKNRDLGALLFPSPEWQAFLDATKRGAF